MLPFLSKISKNLDSIPLKESFRLSTFFWSFASMDQQTLEKLQNTDIELRDIKYFVQFKTQILNYLSQRTVKVIQSRDKQEFKAYYESIIYHMRTLTMLRYFNEGAQTEQAIQYFLPILKFSIEQILTQIEDRGSAQSLDIHL
jgi:O-methyltransferase involved in polyketide biosynthesis